MAAESAALTPPQSGVKGKRSKKAVEMSSGPSASAGRGEEQQQG